MSQRALESTLGRLITDERFRERFFVDPEAVCHSHEVDLTRAELHGLLQLDAAALRGLAGRLDPKIVRALTVCTSEGLVPPAETAKLERRRGN